MCHSHVWDTWHIWVLEGILICVDYRVHWTARRWKVRLTPGLEEPGAKKLGHGHTGWGWTWKGISRECHGNIYILERDMNRRVENG